MEYDLGHEKAGRRQEDTEIDVNIDDVQKVDNIDQ
jgi:hypothetical protein